MFTEVDIKTNSRVKEKDNINSVLKKNLYHKFSESSLYKNVILEHKIGDYSADIYLVNTRKQEIAVKCETSLVNIMDFKQKTAYFSYQGIYTLWIFSKNKELDKRLIKLVQSKGSRLNYKTYEVERKCHRWFYGRIYYFYNDRIYSIHFHPKELWIASACDECLEQTDCSYTEPSRCSKYSPGYLSRSKLFREISIYPIKESKLVCIDRKDKLRIAKFNEPTWWKV